MMIFSKKLKIKISDDTKTCFFRYDCDSLALEGITGFIEYFIEKFIKLSNGILEIRSKSTNIKSIKKFNPCENIIPAFSLNSPLNN